MLAGAQALGELVRVLGWKQGRAVARCGGQAGGRRGGAEQAKPADWDSLELSRTRAAGLALPLTQPHKGPCHPRTLHGGSIERHRAA